MHADTSYMLRSYKTKKNFTMNSLQPQYFTIPKHLPFQVFVYIYRVLTNNFFRFGILQTLRQLNETNYTSNLERTLVKVMKDYNFLKIFRAK